MKLEIEDNYLWTATAFFSLSIIGQNDKIKMNCQ